MKPRVSQPSGEKAVFLGDWHVPYHDPAAVDLALAFVRWFRPQTVFILGDFLDCYAISRYDRDPRERLGLQEELDAGKVLLRRLRQAVGERAEILYLDGNHEDRLPRLLCSLPEFSQLTSLTIPALLDLKALDIQHRTYRQQEQWHGLLVEHGDRASRHSGYTARAMLEARGVSGVSGHTHRLGAHYRTDHAGTRVWYENGCLCRTDNVSYLIGRAPWQQGFSVAHALFGRGRFALEQLPILSGRLFYAGRVWDASTS